MSAPNDHLMGVSASYREEKHGRRQGKKSGMTTAKAVTGRENKLATKKRRAAELCHIAETIVNKHCDVRRGGHSSQPSRTTNYDAYSLYARGRYHLLRSSPDATPKAVAALKAAVAADP